MAETIRWMVVREPVQQRTRLSRQILAVFLIGGFLGGAISGVFVGGIAWLIHIIGLETRGFAIVAIVLALGYAGHVAGLWKLPKPQLPHQVPPAWREVLPPLGASFIYAGVLGMTFFTRIGSLLFYPMLVLLLGLGQHPATIVSAFALAGLGRAATALIVPLFSWYNVGGEAVFDVLDHSFPLARKSELAMLVVLPAILMVEFAST